MIAFHFSWVRDVPAVSGALPDIEAALPLGARPHWGRLFVAGPDELASAWSDLGAVQELRRRVDPTEKFGNAFLDRNLGPLS